MARNNQTLTQDEHSPKALHAVRTPSKLGPLPPTPAKHKRFSVPLFHHGNHGEKLDTKPSTNNEKTDTKDRRTSSATTAASTSVPTRPTMGQINRQNSVQTRYMTMLLHLDEIPRLHNILAAFFTVSRLVSTAHLSPILTPP